MDDLVIRRKYVGMVETDENLPMSLDLVAMLPDGAGEHLAEEMEARGLTADELATASDLGREVLDAILASEVIVTPEISVAIARGLGASELGDFWARLDAKIRLEKARLA